MTTRLERFEGPCTGDPRQEAWPADQTVEQYLETVTSRIHLHDFFVTRLDIPLEPDRIVYLMVGEHWCSRLIALDLNGPRGILHILQDNGTIDTDSIRVMRSVLTITFRELISEGHTGIKNWLELYKHSSHRRPDPTDTTWKTDVPYVTWASPIDSTPN